MDISKRNLDTVQDYFEFIHKTIADIDSIAERDDKKKNISDIINVMMDVLKPKQGLDDDPEYPELRKEYLSFLNKFPWYENLSIYADDMFDILSNIVMNDYEDNAHLALHVIHGLEKYFKGSWFRFDKYIPLLGFFRNMLEKFDDFGTGQAKTKALTSDEELPKVLSSESLSILNEFMELLLLLDQLYPNAPEQKLFFDEFKDRFVYVLAKSYDKSLDPRHAKEFFSLKNCMIFLMFQYLIHEESYQSQFLFKASDNIICMLIINIMHTPPTYWIIKRQFLKFFKEFIIKISKKIDMNASSDEKPNKNSFTEYKDKILDPKFITKHCDNNIEIFKEFSYLIIEFSIRYLKIIEQNYDKTVVESVLQLLRHPLSYPIEKIECAGEYFMRCTILSIQRSDQNDKTIKEKTHYHNELVEAISDASLERAEYLQSLALREERMGTFDNTDEENVRPKLPDDMEVDEYEIDSDRPVLDTDYEFMPYSIIKDLGKTKDVYEKDDPFPLITYSKKLRSRYFARELNSACKRIVYKVPLYFLRSNSYLYLMRKALDVMKKLLKAFFIMHDLCKKHMNVDLLAENNNTLVLLIMLTCCKMPKNDLYDTVRIHSNGIFDVMIMNQTFLKEILVPISDPKSKISEMIASCEVKKIEVKHIRKEDVNIFHYIIIGSGLEYVLNHLKLIGKPYHRYKLTDTSDYNQKAGKEANERVSADYPELLLSLLETLDEAFSQRDAITEQDTEYQSIIHLQGIIFNNLFKIVIGCFRLLKTAECNYLIYLKIIKTILCTYLKRHKKEIGKFKPLILVIIENIMQLRKEIGKKKELNDIMLNLPLGLKHLIEYMPFIFEFIQESFHNKDESNAVETLTHWIRVVSNLNDIIDPIISPSFNELSYDLFDTFQTNYANRTNLYGTIFWLICKLGPKCRLYNDDKIIRIKNNADTGMKIFFKDKDKRLDEVDPRNAFSLGVEDIIEQNSKYIEQIDKTIDNLKPLMLFYINKNSVDVSLIKRCIQNVLKDNDNREIFGDSNPYREYENAYKPLCELDSKISRRNQIRSFELILRMIFAVYLIKDKKDNMNKTTELVKYLTRHFTLIYICKNGTLKNKFGERLHPEEEELLNSNGIKVSSDAFLRTALNEINPLIFIDIL